MTEHPLAERRVVVTEAILFAATRPPGVDVVTLRVEPLVQKFA